MLQGIKSQLQSGKRAIALFGYPCSFSHLLRREQLQEKKVTEPNIEFLKLNA
jgi:hypothetical protein